MKVFPEEPIVIDSFAVARLVSVSKNGRSVYGTFSVEPVNIVKFRSCVESMRGVLGAKYVPVPWIWTRFRLSDDEDDLLLQVGIGKVYCKALADARRSLERRPSSVVSSEQVGYLAESMMRWVGVA